MKTPFGFLLSALLATTVQAGETNEPSLKSDAAPLLAGAPRVISVKTAKPAVAVFPKWAMSASIRTNIGGAAIVTAAVSATNTVEGNVETNKVQAYEYYLKPMTTDDLAQRGMLIGWELKKRKK